MTLRPRRRRERDLRERLLSAADLQPSSHRGRRKISTDFAAPAARRIAKSRHP